MENDTMALTWTATTAKGNTYTHIAYEDPMPGRKGSERIKSSCSWCLGTGVYTGPSGYKFYTPSVGSVDTGCFHCEGRGYTSVLVSSLRSSARRRANAANARRAEEADVAVEVIANMEAAFLAEWDEALAEQARRNAKAKGHLGTIGERLRKVPATVTLYRTYESSNYVTGRPETKAIIKFSLGGPTLVWFTGPRSLEDGQDVVISFTVKDHSVRDGEDQTIITRCIIH